MSHHQTHGRRILPHSLKYPLFFLGLLIIIVGGLGVQKIGAPLNVQVATAAAGFIIMILGIVLE